MPNEPADFPINFFDESEDPLERTKRLSKDCEFMKEYAKSQEEKKLQRQFQTLNNWGIYPQSWEMPRREYLPRLTWKEQDSICGILEYLWLKASRDIPFSVLGVGTILYDDKDWAHLSKLAELENATYYEYETNFSWQKGYQNKRPFSMRDVLARKGEDIDLKLCPQDEYSLKYHHLLSNKAREFALRNNYSYKESKKRSIVGTQYETEPPLGILKSGEPVEVRRIKLIGDTEHTISISMPNSRPIHLYFSTMPIAEKLRDERANGYAFSLLQVESDVHDFMDAIKNGRESGIYENPVLLAHENSMREKNRKK